MDERTINTYDKAASTYAQKFNTIGSRRGDIERAFSLLGKQPEESSVVEIGCGNGRDAAVITEFTKRFVGIDASKEMIQLAREYLPNVDFQVADIAEFDIPQETDIVFSFASLLHFSKEEIQEILHVYYKRLSDNALVYISLKRAPYEKRVIEDEFGPRVFYFYEKVNIRKFTEDLYELVYYDEQIRKEVDWLTAVLRKITP